MRNSYQKCADPMNRNNNNFLKSEGGVRMVSDETRNTEPGGASGKKMGSVPIYPYIPKIRVDKEIGE